MRSYLLNRSDTHCITNFVASKTTLNVLGVFPAFHVQMNKVDKPVEKLINISRGDEDFIRIGVYKSTLSPCYLTSFKTFFNHETTAGRFSDDITRLVGGSRGQSM